MSSKGDQESTRRGPLPHKYHKPAPARVWGKLLGVASKSRDGSCQRGGDQPPRSCPSALAGQNVAGPRHKGNVQRVGKSGGLPAFWPLVGVSTSASGRYCYAGPAGRCGVVQRWGGDLGFGSGALPVPKPRARRDWGFWCGVVLYGLDICRRGDANIRNWILGSLGLGFHRRRWASLPRAERVPSGSIIEVEGPGRIRGQGSSQC